MTMTDVSPVTRARWLAVFSVSVGTFTIVTSEMLPVGLLTSIAATLGVSDGTAGLMMSAPGLVAAASAPVLAFTTRRLDRRVTLMGLMALLAVADLMGAFAPNYPVMLAARVLTGVSIGGFWAFAAGLGVRLVPEGAVGRATSIILAGVSVASVLGVPVGAFISSFAGWRTAFVAMGVLALALVGLLATALPPLPGEPRARVPEPSPRATPVRGPAWLSGPLKVVLVLTVLIVSGHFAAYTYVRPFLEQISQAGPAFVSAALLLYGAAGVAGNFAAGAWAARNPRPVLVVLAVLMALATAALPLIGLPLVVLVVWGLGYGGVGVTLQLWIMRSGGGEMGTALFVGAFNVSIALGSFAGGRVVDGASLSAVMWAGAVLAAVGAAVAAFSGRTFGNGRRGRARR
ncbi:MFS transporter [Sphaerisporangium siamense]|uniref:Putative MFS family arabinose efflux permease n=1 Tax=Sphaerisporangium siamense TaxID=795645 RepID=A0A7W7DBP2_9ACTN|nr:MFS transporter [Sphaerisporangium siamense]MBB4703875.1 putative MFS family arabinose efflux permease [Sphaerisporangium siamense]GII82344.1 MFS transporter [Sphaerisporangium siamense]